MYEDFTEADLSMAVSSGMHALRKGSNELFRIASSGKPEILPNGLSRCLREIFLLLERETVPYSIIINDVFNDATPDDSPTWVIGISEQNRTIAYERYSPEFFISLALLVNRKPVLGIVSAPLIKKMFCAVKGRGAYCNGQRIHVTSEVTLDKSVVFVCPDSTQYFDNYEDMKQEEKESMLQHVFDFQKELILSPVHSLRAIGSPDLEMCFIAAGKASASIFPSQDLCMQSAGVLILQEAKGDVFRAHSPFFSRKNEITFATCSKHLYKSIAAMAKKHSFSSSVS